MTTATTRISNVKEQQFAQGQDLTVLSCCNNFSNLAKNIIQLIGQPINNRATPDGAAQTCDLKDRFGSKEKLAMKKLIRKTNWEQIKHEHVL